MRRLLSFCLVSLLLISCTRYQPSLSVNKVSLTWSNQSTNTAVFTIDNIGEEKSVLKWETSSDSPLVTTSPPSGSLTEGEEGQVVKVIIDNGALKLGRYDYTLKISSNGGDATLDLSFEMESEGVNRCGVYPEVPAISEQPASVEPADAPYVPGQLLVGFRTDAFVTGQSNAAHEHLRNLSLAVSGEFELSTLQAASAFRPALVRVAKGQDLLETAQRLARDPRVAYAEPNYYLEPLELEPSDIDDPLLAQQWHLLEFGLEEAWGQTTGGEDVVIAIIDNGFDTDHEDLQAKLLPGCDFHNNDNDPAAGNSNDDHGTHVAGIAAAIGGNDTGVVGVAPGGVKLLPLKALPDIGTGNVSNLINAMLWAAGLEPEGFGENFHPADIISISLGLDPKDEDAPVDQIRAIDETAKQVYERGVFILAASGNASKSDRIYAPASSPWIAAVGSVNSDYKRSDFSNYDETGVSVDFLAPGGIDLDSGASILSTETENTYGTKAGTSMSTPFVAGAAALILSQSPGLSPQNLKARLSDTAFFDPTTMNEAEYGAGVICVDRALGAATQCGRLE